MSLILARVRSGRVLWGVGANGSAVHLRGLLDGSFRGSLGGVRVVGPPALDFAPGPTGPCPTRAPAALDFAPTPTRTPPDARLVGSIPHDGCSLPTIHMEKNWEPPP